MAAGKERPQSLLEYSGIYNPDQDFDSIYTRFTARRIALWLKPAQRILELGSATSLMTSLLSSGKLSFECVEKAQDYITIAKGRKLPNVTHHHATLEEFSPTHQFHHILMTNLIHELETPIRVLQKVADWLLPGGKLHVTSPNPDSVHRKVAVIAGMLKDVTEISERGRKFLTLRLYRNQEVVDMAEQGAHLKLVHRDGILFKPLTNAQMEGLEKNILEAFDALAHEFTENSAMTYFVFEKEE